MLRRGAVSSPVGQYCDLAVLAACGDEGVSYRLATGARVEISAVWFEDCPQDSFKVDLRPAFFHLC